MRSFLLLIISIIFLCLVRAEIENNVGATVTVKPAPGKVYFSPTKIEAHTIPISILEKNLVFWQENGNSDLQVTLNSSLDFISFSENNLFPSHEYKFILPPNQNKTIKIFINTPLIGIYQGAIYISTKEKYYPSSNTSIPVNLVVDNKYDIILDITSPSLVLTNNVPIKTELKKISQDKIEGKFKVDLTYNIFKKNILITTHKTSLDLLDYTESTIYIPMPYYTKFGIYTINVAAKHLDKSAEDTAKFLFIRRFRR